MEGLNKIKVVKKLKELKRLIEYCKLTKYAAFDFETTGLKYYEKYEKLTVLSISYQPGSAWVIPLDHFESKFSKKTKKILDALRLEIFENYDIIKVAWNLKFEYKWLMRYGIYLKGRLFDGMLAKYLLDEMRPMGLKEFVDKVFPKYSGYESSTRNKDWSKIPFKVLAPYAALDTDLTLRSMIYMEPKLIKLGFYNLFRNLLMMHTRVLAESEYRGIDIDREYLEQLMEKYEALIKEQQSKLCLNKKVLKYDRLKKKEVDEILIEALKKEIREIKDGDSKQKDRVIKGREEKIKQILQGDFKGKVGKLKGYEKLNFASPKQLIDLLFISKYGFRFKILRYTVDKKTKKPTSTPSTDESVLVELKPKDKSGLLENLLKLRELEKLYSTYIKGIHEKLSSQNKIHASFLIHGTVTGRLSCVDPNLQNIPRDTTASDIKKMFLPPPGQLLLEVDYGQAELRVLAEMAEDKAMIEIFKKGFNIHVATACKAYYGNLDKYNEVKGIISKADTMSGSELERPENKNLLAWAKRKKAAKTVNFGIIYGQGDEKLAMGMGESLEYAANFKKDWFKSYPQAVAEMERLRKFASRNGYVLNMFGRKRRLPDAQFRDKWHAKSQNMMGKYMEALRQAVNAPIQGASSDFTSFSQIIIRKYKKLGWLPKTLNQLYTVHDSIGFGIDPKDVHWVLPIIIKICDNPETQRYFNFQLKHVQMKVGGELGLNWGNLREYDAWTNYTKLLTKDSIN